MVCDLKEPNILVDSPDNVFLTDFNGVLRVGEQVAGNGLHTFPDDPAWRGWWDEEPPFHVPVFVLTHGTPKPSIEM